MLVEKRKMQSVKILYDNKGEKYYCIDLIYNKNKVSYSKLYINDMRWYNKIKDVIRDRLINGYLPFSEQDRITLKYVFNEEERQNIKNIIGVQQ